MNDDDARAERVEALALECLERLAQEGASVVDRICREHPELAAHIRGVVAELGSAGLLDGPPRERQRLGDFTLVRRLGHGGMGVVWLAEQHSLGRRVALKLLRTGFQRDARSRERFRREVLALSRLDHPAICTVYEAGEVDDTPYLAMRFVDGESLAARLDRRRRGQRRDARTSTTARDLDDAVHLVEKLARALHVAHAVGIVHRDVKPQNVLIEASGEPVLVDFGLAHADDPALSDLTRSGEPLGTPAYMAPEQVAGTGAIDGRTDVWALGVVLYECLTLRTPFDAPTRDALYHAILRDPLPNPHAFNRAVGRDLHAVLAKALDKEPRRRFGTALELADELARIRRREPIRTRAPGLVLRTRRWCQRNRTATAVLATMAVSLAVALALLQRATVAERSARARALLDAASEVRQENPQFAFKLAREALTSGDTRALVYAQEVLFDLRHHEVVREAPGMFDWVEFSPDGSCFVSSGQSQAPAVHRAADGQVLAQLPHRMLQTPAIAFAPDVPQVAIGTAAGDVAIHGLDGSTEPVLVLDGRPDADPVRHVAFSADGRQVVATYDDGSASLWARGSGARRDLALDANTTSGWFAAAFLPDGSVVAAGALWPAGGAPPRALVAADGPVPRPVVGVAVGASRFLTRPSGSSRLDLWRHDGSHAGTRARGPGETQAFTSAEFDPAGERVVASYNDGLVWLLDQDGNPQRVHTAPRPGSVQCARFSPDGRRLVLAENSGLVEVWDLDRDRLALIGHRGTAFHACFAPDGRRVVSASWDGTVRLWNGEPFAGVPERSGYSRPDVLVVGDRVVWTTGTGQVAVGTADRIDAAETVGAGWSHLGLAPDRRTVVVACEDGTVWRWDPAQSTPPERIAQLDGMAWDAFLLADGRLVARGGQLVVLWADGVPQRTLSERASRLAADPDGTRILIGEIDGGWQLLELRGGELGEVVRDSGTNGRPVAGLAFSADAQRALIGSYDGLVELWQLAPKKPLLQIVAHQHAVHGVAFAPDDARFVTASQDGSVHVYDIDDPARPVVLRVRDRAAVFRAVFVDSQRLVTASADGSLRWWSLDAERADRLVASIPIPPITPLERDRFPHLLR